MSGGGWVGRLDGAEGGSEEMLVSPWLGCGPLRLAGRPASPDTLGCQVQSLRPSPMKSSLFQILNCLGGSGEECLPGLILRKFRALS